eukprot:TRINITY_DN858_c0_g2_i6.p1 TRINITY_DN858_c0_g2~~TRINITY_DN858_c0_g2_i6.p1  ORF type:complete len:1022 (+),score=324.15 TRINITY_DN858_c0_g2_i6:58-3066(+)
MPGANGKAPVAARWHVADQKHVEGTGLYVTFDAMLPSKVPGGFVGVRPVGGEKFENFTAVSTVGEKVVIHIMPARRPSAQLQKALATPGTEVEARPGVLGLRPDDNYAEHAVYYALNAAVTPLALTPIVPLLRWNVADAGVNQPKVLWTAHSAEEVDFVADILKHLPREAGRDHAGTARHPLLWVVLSGRHGKFDDMKASVSGLKAALVGENPTADRTAAVDAAVRVFEETEGVDRLPDYICKMAEVAGDTSVVVETMSCEDLAAGLTARLGDWSRRPEDLVAACGRVDLGGVDHADVERIRSAMPGKKAKFAPLTAAEWGTRRVQVMSARNNFGFVPGPRSARVDYEPLPITSWLPPFSFSFVPLGRSTLGLHDWMFLPTDPLPLALFRIAFGYLCADYAYDQLYWGDAYRTHIRADMRFKYDYFEFLGADLPERLMYLMYYIMFFSAIGMMLGFPYRLSCFGFGFSFMWHFFAESTHYNNHHYLMWFLGYVFMIVRADACLKFSPWRTTKYIAGLLVGSKAEPASPVTPIPYFHHFCLRGLVLFVFWYGFVAKCNNDWNSGHAFRGGMEDEGFPWIINELVVFFLVWGGTVFDMAGPLFLVHSPMRVPALLGFTFFNVMNMIMFTIGCFPWMMLGSIPLLCETQTTRLRLREFLKWCAAREGRLSAPLRSIGKILDPVFPAYTDSVYQLRQHETYYTQPNGILRPPAPKPMRSYPKVYRMLLMVLLWAFCSFHVTYPLRNWVYHYGTEQTVAWTEHGRKFSWHMMSRHKACRANITLVIPDSEPMNYTHDTTGAFNGPVTLYSHQIKKLGHVASYYRQLARGIRCAIEKKFKYSDVKLYVDAWCSVNGSPYQPFVDPSYDLSRELPPTTPGEREPWILDQTKFGMEGYPDLYPYKSHEWSVLEGVNPTIAGWVVELQKAMLKTSVGFNDHVRVYVEEAEALAKEWRPTVLKWMKEAIKQCPKELVELAGPRDDSMWFTPPVIKVTYDDEDVYDVDPEEEL